ncbi:MFS transporter [Streptomyces sp. A7024]|uniref:MFS transporter n=2 Tax=Streptomyces coryli TaxID=1128680 RepID=A0A6G4UAI7_9ACTN|nr:MFS transporter [Streptomyces coryli]NGN68706.1 MFS transporter [Streptomyces coryli]
MFLVDATVVNVALPYIASDLHFSATGMSWVLNLYTLAFGGLLLLGSRIGDRIGRRRALVIGVLAFTAASLLGGFAPSGEWLLIFRTLQGAAAALAAPSTLALIATTFAEGAERGRALSVFSSISGAGASIGLILGGALTDWIDWRWVLFINVPIGLAIAALAPRYVAETPRQRGSFDATGALTGTLGVTALVYGFIRAAEEDWGDGLALGAFGTAVLLLAAFLATELRVRQPLVALRLFTDRNRALSYAAMLMIPGGMFGTFYFSTQYLQAAGLGFSPLRAGLAFMPMTIPLFAAARLAPRAQARFGPKRVALAGTALNTAGAVWLSQLSAGTGYWAGLFGPLVLIGVGIGLTMMQINTLILAGVRAQDAGSASGLLQTMQQLGGSLGLAVLVTVFGAATSGTGGDGFISGASAAFAGGAVFSAAAFLVVLGVKPPKRQN